MMHDAPERASFPVSPENTPTKRRAVFSASFAGLTSHHVQPDIVTSTSRRRRNLDDDSLRLIDDLTNRPMDVMYTDSRLATKTPSLFSVWFTRVLVFLICIAVGTAGSVFVRQLSTDPRKEVRKQLSSQLSDQTKNVETLTKDVNALRARVEEESKSVSNWSLNQTIQDDEMVNGVLPVQGEGITLTIANPISVSGDNADSSLPRENGSQVRVVTDSDLQVLVSLLWQSGAEAIAINGYRLGVQTSIRTAGTTILIGVNSVQSPYRIEAIGNSSALANAVSKKTQKRLYDDFKEAGIYPQVSRSKSIDICKEGQVMAAVLGLIIGVVIGVFVRPDIPIALQPYLPIMVLAALDALLGAARAYFQRSFSDKVFVISFFSNVITATLLVFLGNQLGVGSQLQTAVIVVLGIRIFTNVSSIRRFIFKG